MVMPTGGHEPTPSELIVALMKSLGIQPPQPLSKDEITKRAADTWFTEAKRVESLNVKDCECLVCVTGKREGKMIAAMCRAAAHMLLGKPEGWTLLVESFAKAEACHPECFKPEV